MYILPTRKTSYSRVTHLVRTQPCIRVTLILSFLVMIGMPEVKG